MRKSAIFIFGAPGAGKGTQANLLAWTKGFIHFDSGKHLRSVLYDPSRQGEQLIKKERELNEAGILNTPSWILGIFKEQAEKVAKADLSIVYSGSPRTMYEAFGDDQNIGLVQFLEQIYGKNNLYFIFLNVSAEVAAERNKIRRICTVCTTPVLGDSPVKSCPVCEGELKIRIDDNPEKYKVRLNEYTQRTLPILNELKKRGFQVHELSGEQKPPKVFADIVKAVAL